jgi:hypothetical protein
MKKLTKDTPWKNNWASYRAVDRSGKLYEYNVKPRLNLEMGNTWCINTMDAPQFYDFVDDGYEFTTEAQFRVKEGGEIITPTTPDHHTLPCGTKIPPEGIQAWVKYGSKSDWREYPETIVACANGRYAIFSNGVLTYGVDYSLTDPNAKTEPKKRKITPIKLYMKTIYYNDGSKALVTYANERHVIVNGQVKFVDNLERECKGYSDTPTSELKPFWVEEQ